MMFCRLSHDEVVNSEHEIVLDCSGRLTTNFRVYLPIKQQGRFDETAGIRRILLVYVTLLQARRFANYSDAAVESYDGSGDLKTPNTPRSAILAAGCLLHNQCKGVPR